MYKLVKPKFENRPANMVQRLSDGAFIPMTADNTDYQEYLKWVEAGNTPQAADAATEPADEQSQASAENTGA